MFLSKVAPSVSIQKHDPSFVYKQVFYVTGFYCISIFDSMNLRNAKLLKGGGGGGVYTPVEDPEFQATIYFGHNTIDIFMHIFIICDSPREIQA